eukprot:5872564-Prorocentrum_lima.AAC.1
MAVRTVDGRTLETLRGRSRWTACDGGGGCIVTAGASWWGDGCIAGSCISAIHHKRRQWYAMGSNLDA